MPAIKKSNLKTAAHSNGNGSGGHSGKTRLSVQKTYKLYINGAFPRTESGRYYTLSGSGGFVANVCRSSRKDFRDAVVAARAACKGWGARAHFNRGQILYRIAEILEGRRAQFIDEMQTMGLSHAEAVRELDASVDRIVYYAGWADKYQQVFSSVNPVSSSHFNFTLQEPTGVVTVFAPETSALLGLISAVIPAITGGNTVVALASRSLPLCAITFAEVLNSSDVPGGVVNILTGNRDELLSHFSTHLDVNAMVYYGDNKEEISAIRQNATSNVKRISIYPETNLSGEDAAGPYHILALQETKTTWHPVGI